MKIVTVRGFGYRITHLAEVPQPVLRPMWWPTPDHPFTGIMLPVVTLCEIQMRSVQDMVVVMEAGTPVRCRACRLVLKYREQAVGPER